MSKTSVTSDLLQSLQVVTEFTVETVGKDLGVLSINNIALTIEEPRWNLVLRGVLDDRDDTLKLFGGKLTGTII